MSESQHWYTRTGEPRHFIEKADGSGLRATTLRDARKEDLVPSFSTVDSIRNKYQLNKWVLEQAIRESHRIGANTWIGYGEDEYTATILAHLEETAGQRLGSDEGTAIHAAIEAETRGNEYPAKYNPHVQAALNKVAELFPDVEDWESERTFANPELGFGGMVDLHSPSTGIICDFKSKSFRLDSEGNPVRENGRKYRLDYDQAYQLSAYQRGLRLPLAPCANVFISRLVPGAVTHRVWTVDELDYGWRVFEAELYLWRLEKEYDPRVQAGAVEAVA